MTSLTFQENQDDCCFSSYFRNGQRIKNRQLEEKTLSHCVSFRNGAMTFKNQQKNIVILRDMDYKAETAQKVNKNDGRFKQTVSQTKNGEMSITRKIVNVKLNYSMDNCEDSNASNRQIAIEQVESQVYRKSEISEDKNNIIISQSEILHNYFDSSEHIKAIQPHNTEIKPEQPKKIKRLFKTQRHT